MSLFIKGTVIALKENWENDPGHLSSSIIFVMENWRQRHYNSDNTPVNDFQIWKRKSYGEVRQALVGLENDVHNLSVIYHQLKHFENCKIDVGLKDLYFSNLTESYFTNIRSIYDHLSCFPRIVLSDEELKSSVAGVTSFNSLLGFCDKSNKLKRSKGEATYSEQILWAIEQCSSNFNSIKQVRDAIIHHGKETIVTTKNDQVLFRVPAHVGDFNSKNILPNILELDHSAYPLFDYLKFITVEMFKNMEVLGNSIALEYQSNGGTFDSWYTLIGICMQDFLTSLFPDGKLAFFKSVKYFPE